MAAADHSPAREGVADFDLHGMVGVRLVDAAPGDVAAVARQLGPIAGTLEREPEVVVRFVDRLVLSSPVRLIGLDDAGFTDDAFLVLRGKQKSTVRTIVPLAEIGGRCEIVCERGMPAVPLLLPVVNLTALARGFAPVHASAFVHDGLGVLVAGWAKGGKTETLLAFTARGAEYVGDEWVYVTEHGDRMCGLPEPMRLWDWHLRAMPGLADRIDRKARSRLASTRSASAIMRRAASAPGISGTGTGRTLARARALLERQLSVQVPPQHLFGERVRTGWAPLDRVVLAVSRERDGIGVADADGREVAARAAASARHEWLDLLAYYWKFRFAFPGARNPLVEEIGDRTEHLLASAFAGARAHVLEHPYPFEIPRLFDELAPRLRP